jgi:two-component system chemotaxis response regulator CheY
MPMRGTLQTKAGHTKAGHTKAGHTKAGQSNAAQTEAPMLALVVDDATTVRLYHRGILERAGFAVAEAMNGLEGLERALSGVAPPDLLLVDVNMPRMDGYAFLRAVRLEPSLRDCPAIMISTEAAAQDADQAFAAGANLYLVKPVRPEALARAARALVGLQPRVAP